MTSNAQSNRRGSSAKTAANLSPALPFRYRLADGSDAASSLSHSGLISRFGTGSHALSTGHPDNKTPLVRSHTNSPDTSD